jgi:hypothetical protein
MAEQRKQLDMTIRADLRDFVEEEHIRTGKPTNSIVDELLEFAIAHRRGEITEQQSLHDIVESALSRTKAELRAELREDMRQEIVEALQEVIRQSTDRMIALLVRAVRDVAIIRRLVYTIIAKAYTPEFARQIYEDAREKAGKELRPKSEDGK